MKGVNGEGTFKMIHRLETILKVKKYSHVVILGGTNDIGRVIFKTISNIILLILPRLY